MSENFVDLDEVTISAGKLTALLMADIVRQNWKESFYCDPARRSYRKNFFNFLSSQDIPYSFDLKKAALEEAVVEAGAFIERHRRYYFDTEKDEKKRTQSTNDAALRMRPAYIVDRAAFFLKDAHEISQELQIEFQEISFTPQGESAVGFKKPKRESAPSLKQPKR